MVAVAEDIDLEGESRIKGLSALERCLASKDVGNKHHSTLHSIASAIYLNTIPP